MNKVISKFKDDVENVEVPIDELDAVIEKGIFGSVRKDRRSEKILYSVATAILFLVILLGSGYVSPTMADVLSKIPFINSVLPFTDAGLETADEKGLVKSIGQTVDQNGISMTVTDVYYDHSRLEIGYSIPFKEKDPETMKQYKTLGIAKADIKVDSQEVGYSILSTLENDYITGTITIEDNDLPKSKDKVNFFIDVTEVLNKKGHWKFQLTASKAEQNTVIHLEKTVTTKDYTFTIESIKLTPSSTKMDYTFSVPSNNDDFNEQALEFNIITDTGEAVDMIKKDMIFIENIDNRKQFKSKVLFEPIQDVGSLTITPIIKNPEGEDEILEDLELEMRIHE
ncbi:DUF4179 domain-containing protein [Rossellomorea sp. KS-H15a]|uniref:DUF4179 domain-containing protein n=1 Tax=Rossellomorea sp. KS-H15a TaxID=2963940 RepID=UPI0020C6B5C9|nr:DUF4179 domain-containing protein [Rossellomorea sp. KS-H15a]UTE76625.1 DUF4179 domain-containing protein [Rossellomorea sp. KS-H15a]